MPNNYFKLHHYIPIMGMRLDVRTLLFFFDDRDPDSVEQAFSAALACTSTISTLTFGRRVQLSVYRHIGEHPEVAVVGAFDADSPS